MPQRNVATNFTFEQQRAEINLLAQDFWTQKGTVDTASSTYLKHDGTNNFTGATLAVPAAFTINSNSGAGTVTIAGNLQVDGTTTTVNTATMDVVDKNITIAKGSANDAAADGAGITIDSATDITFNFVDAKDALVSSIGLEATTFLKGPYGQFTGSGTPSAGQGLELNAPDANTGQIISYDRGNSAYKDLRIKGTGIDFYAGSTNAIVGGFHNTGLIMQSGKGITGNVTGDLTGNVTGDLTGSVLTAAQTNITSVGTLTTLQVANHIGLGVAGAEFGSGVKTVVLQGGSATKSGCIDFKENSSGTRLGNIFVQNDATYGMSIGTQCSGEAGDFIRFHTGALGSERLRIAADGDVTVEAGLLSAQGGQAYASSASTLATSVTTAALRVKGATNSSDSLWMGVETTDATPYIQGSNGVGNLAKKLLLNPFGGNVGIGLVNPDCEFHVKGAGSVARFEGTGGSSFLDLYDSDDDTRCFVGVDGGTFKVQTSANSWSDKLTVTPAGVVTVNIDNNDTDHTNNSLPAGVSGLYTRNSNGTSGTFSAISMIASSSGAASDQSASLVTKCTGSGLSPEVYLTQRDGNNSQRNTIAINTLGDVTFIGRVSDHKGSLRRLPQNSQSGGYNLVSADAGKHINTTGDIGLYNGNFEIGDAITVFNKGTADIAISLGGGVTMYQAGTTNVGNRMLAAKGICTILCTEKGSGTNTFVISGAGLS